MALPGPHYHSRFTSNVADISPGIPCNTKFRMEFELYAILGIPDAWNGSLCTPVKDISECSTRFLRARADINATV